MQQHLLLKIGLFFLGLQLLSCEGQTPLPQRELIDSMDFFFEEASGEIPTFISINSQEDGKHIYTFSPVASETHQVSIPQNFQAEAYTISYISDANYTYLGKKVMVRTFRDIRTKSIVHSAPDEFSFDYKKLTITSSRPIEAFINGPGGNYYNKIAPDGLSAKLELGVTSLSGRGRVIIAKLQDENAYRYYSFEDPMLYPGDSLDISTFSTVNQVQEISLDNKVRSGRMAYYTLYPSQQKLGKIYDSYKMGFTPGFPLISGDFTYLSTGDFLDEDGRRGIFVSKGIEQKLKPLDFNIDVSDPTFSGFQQNISAVDIQANSFQGEHYFWHHFDGIWEGFQVIKPELSQEVLDKFPDLAKDSELYASTLLRKKPGPDIAYDDLVLPGNRFFFSFYQSSPAYPYYTKEGDLFLMEATVIKF